MKPYNKYRAQKTVVGNETFDSKKEAKRWQELLLLERAGQIWDLCRQVKYQLIPAQYRYINGKERCVERACDYYADFVYKDSKGLHVEDAKGMKTDAYRIKKKLMLYVHEIIIEEV
jgi:hypothetical protein